MKLAIKGHSTRGNEVIEILKMMGGYNICDYLGGDQKYLQYFINNKGNIDVRYSMFNHNNYKVFTLEEFLKKYPFKIGDKVIDCYGNLVTIKSMKWSEKFETMIYDFEDSAIVLAAEDMKLVDDNTKPSKMKNILAALRKHFETTSKEELEREFDEIKEWLNVGPTIDEYIKFCEYINEKSKYPTTYEECCKKINACPIVSVSYDSDEDMLYNDGVDLTFLMLRKLIICRDAYWKIAGEKLGLGKPWEPDWNSFKEIKYCLYTIGNKIKTGAFRDKNIVLAFPTEEMRDTFYENFKDLIEQCKELL